jgi:hypothetical protein
MVSASRPLPTPREVIVALPLVAEEVVVIAISWVPAW